MKRHLQIILALALITLSCNLLAAEEDAATETPKEPVAPEIENVRDPFWPVGWRPPKVVESVPDQGTQAPAQRVTIQWEKAKKSLKIAGFGTNQKGEVTAYISGKGFVQTGDIVSVVYDGLQYRWKVTKVTNAGIATDRIDVKAKR